jgi:elongation factor P
VIRLTTIITTTKITNPVIARPPDIGISGLDCQRKAPEVRRIGEASPDRYNFVLPLIDCEGLTRVATTNDLKNGMVLDLDGQLWSVVWFQHHKPGKGGAVVRTKLKNVLSGKVVDKTFNADVKVDVATVDKRDMTYLYNDGSSYVFMDKSTYDQLQIQPEVVGDAAHFLLENQDAIVAVHDDLPLYVELPASVELVVEYTEPGLQGDRSSGGTKPARLETGYDIQVPLFLTTGEKVKVDTRTGDYLGRVNS